MASHLPLQGIRIHLSASVPNVPDEATAEQAKGVEEFAEEFACAVLAAGGTLVHGSHPSIVSPLLAAAGQFIEAGGTRDALTLVRAAEYAVTDEHKAEIEEHRKAAAVQIIPSRDGSKAESLLSMRDWMADRTDVVVAIGGKWWKKNRDGAGVITELNAALDRGNPGFALGGFGGAVGGYLGEDDCDVFPRLRNGLSRSRNQEMAGETSIDTLIGDIINQIKRLPLKSGNAQHGRLFRILALDGGGIRGAFTAAVLSRWVELMGENGGTDFIRHFDLVAGTSTGAILAVGLGLGKTPREILEFYKSKGPQIFPKGGKIRHWLKSKHESKTLREILKDAFGTNPEGNPFLLKESSCRLVVPTVRAVHGVAEVIVTPHAPDRTSFGSYTAYNAALASASAPTYFDAAHVHTDIATHRYLDGGVWANNPVVAAIAEAVGPLQIPLDRIDVLSIGTLETEADFSARLEAGMLGWANEVSDLFFAAQESAAARLTTRLLSPARHLRVNQQTSIEIDLADVSAMTELLRRGSHVGTDTFNSVSSRFLDGFHAPPWQSF